MGRKLLMVLLGVGAVAGFATGFARMCHGGFGHYGPGSRFDHHGDFERRVADTCAESALRVYNRQSPPGAKALSLPALQGFGAMTAPIPALTSVPVASSARAMDLNVLIVDDDERLYELLAQYLAENGVIAKRAATGPLGLKAIEGGESYDAVLLDVMLPGLDGLSLLKRVREKSQIPVIMLTAKGDETDRVVGLELGADDYLAKPFSPRELLARLRAVLRRTQVDPNREQLTVGSMLFDVAARSVQKAGQAIELTGLEFDLLLALARRAGRVVPRSNLLELAGRSDVNVSDRTVDVHVSHIRKKLGDDDAVLLKTVRGVGYVLTRE